MEDLAAKLFTVYRTSPTKNQFRNYLRSEISKYDFFPIGMSREDRHVLTLLLIFNYDDVVNTPMEETMIDDPDSTKGLFRLRLTNQLRDCIREGTAKAIGQPVTKEFWLTVTNGIKF